MAVFVKHPVLRFLHLPQLRAHGGRVVRACTSRRLFSRVYVSRRHKHKQAQAQARTPHEQQLRYFNTAWRSSSGVYGCGGINPRRTASAATYTGQSIPLLCGRKDDQSKPASRTIVKNSIRKTIFLLKTTYSGSRSVTRFNIFIPER